MLNIKSVDRIPNKTIYNLTETTPLIVRARTRQLKFIGHVLRLPNDELAKEYALIVPSHGKGETRKTTDFMHPVSSGRYGLHAELWSTVSHGP